jgi:arsenate reductase
MMTIAIHQNPACGASRNTLAMIRQSGEEPIFIEYLKDPPSRAQLVELLATMAISAREVLRQTGTPCETLDLADPNRPQYELINFMLNTRSSSTSLSS